MGLAEVASAYSDAPDKMPSCITTITRGSMASEEKPRTTAAGDEAPEDSAIWITPREIAETALDARAERDRLLGQICEVNEKLVVAIVEAQQRADEANAARVAADHNEERFRSLVQTSSALVWRATSDGVVQVDPDTWQKFTGVVPGPDAWSWLEAVHPDDRDRVRETWTAERLILPITTNDRQVVMIHLRTTFE